MDIYERLDKLLAERNISRRRLAIDAKIPPSTLQSALARKRGLTIENLVEIALALDMDVCQLLSVSVPTE